MYDVTSDVKAAPPAKRLVVRLTKIGEPERTLEFSASSDEARVIGRSPDADVVLRDTGVLPIHCYFEREEDDIWLAPAQGVGTMRLNYQPVIGRTKLGARSILELGEARLQVLVLEEHESEPHHGPFGTELIDRSAQGVAPDLLVTKSVDARAAFDEYPTTAWQIPRIVAREIGAAEAARGALLSNTHPSPELNADTVIIERAATRPEPRKPGEWTTTVRIPPATVESPLDQATGSMAVAPRLPLGDGRPTTSSAENGGRTSPVDPADETLPGTNLEGGALALDTVLRSAPSTFAKATTGADLFATVGQPIAELLGEGRSSPEKARTSTPAIAGRIAQLRQRLASGPAREPKIVGLIALMAALSMSAFVSQAVRGWRVIAPSSVAIGEPAQARDPIALSTSNPAAAPAQSSVGRVAPPSASSAGLASPTIEPETKDPLVNEAVDHLLLGRQVEAARAYAALATRYPNEQVYAVTAGVLRRRLHPECNESSESKCTRTSQ